MRHLFLGCEERALQSPRTGQGVGVGQGHVWGRMGLQLNLELLPSSWVTSGNLLNLSEPWSPATMG